MYLGNLLLSLILTVSLYGCGKSNSGAAHFEVTRSFATGNSQFDGGLYIHGKNLSTNEEFSLTLRNQTNTSINLDFGRYEIKVVGWDNDPDPFEGDALCDRQIIDFRNEVQNESFKVARSQCNSSHIFNSGYATQKLKIYSCGALYNPSSPLDLRSSKPETNFCDDYPKLFSAPLKSAKIILHNKSPKGPFQEAMASKCLIPSSQSSNLIDSNITLPTKIPITIVLYDDDNCSPEYEVGKNFYPQGLDHNLSRRDLPFDSILSTGAQKFLALASPYSRRGTTPYLSMLPEILCPDLSTTSESGNNFTMNSSGTTSSSSPTFDSCLKLPPLPPLPAGTGNYDYILGVGFNRIVLQENISCQTMSVTFTAPDISMLDCINENDKTILEILVNYLPSNPGIVLNITTPNSPISYEVLINNNIHTFKDLVWALGYTKNSTELINSMDEGKDEDSSKGDLGIIWDLLSPSKIGGFYWDQTCSSSLLPFPINKYVRFQKDNGPIDLELSLTNSPLAGYHRRIIASEFKTILGYRPITILDISCNAKTGRLEEQFEDYYSDEIKSEKKLLFWDTTNNENAQFEKYSLEEVHQNNSNRLLTRTHTSFSRVQKLSESKVKVTQLNYDFSPNISNQGSNPSHFEKASGQLYEIEESNIIKKEAPFLSKTTSVPTFFTDDYLQFEKEQAHFDLNPDSILKYAAEENNYVHVYKSTSASASSITMKFFNGNNILPLNITNTYTHLAADISYDGTKAVVIASIGNQIHFYHFDDNQWSTNFLVFSTTATISKLSISLNDDGEYLLVAQTSTEINYIQKNIDDTVADTLSYNSITNLTRVLTGKTTTPDENFWIIAEYSGQINFCKLNESTKTCTLSPVVNSNTNYLYGVHSKEDIVLISAKSCPAGSSCSLKTYRSNTTGGSNSFNEISNNNYSQFSLFSNLTQMDMNDITFSSTTAPTPPTPVPFVNLKAPSFKMNYRSLDPGFMKKNVFTEIFEEENN